MQPDLQERLEQLVLGFPTSLIPCIAQKQFPAADVLRGNNHSFTLELLGINLHLQVCHLSQYTGLPDFHTGRTAHEARLGGPTVGMHRFSALLQQEQHVS